ncbi:hypothetical protein UY3_18960 [Chelonia mydas]|uniref:Uncharacterized protein n=1 Tax=Chelonia mydas TaxID=8469 RepID=M7AGI0_CHEMY|nr:hypothetical protein UY3_18960 [Chelonia mydas]
MSIEEELRALNAFSACPGNQLSVLSMCDSKRLTMQPLPTKQNLLNLKNYAHATANSKKFRLTPGDLEEDTGELFPANEERLHCIPYSAYATVRKCSKCIKCINSVECFHSTEARVDFRSVALWVAIPQFPQSPLPIGILG